MQKVILTDFSKHCMVKYCLLSLFHDFFVRDFCLFLSRENARFVFLTKCNTVWIALHLGKSFMNKLKRRRVKRREKEDFIKMKSIFCVWLWALNGYVKKSGIESHSSQLKFNSSVLHYPHSSVGSARAKLNGIFMQKILRTFVTVSILSPLPSVTFI